MADEDDDLPQAEGDDAAPNASTEEGVQRQRKSARQRAKEQQAVIANLLSSAGGRRFYHDIVFRLCAINEPLTNPTLNNDYTLFREGARQVGLDLQNRALQAAPEQYMVLLAENLHKP
jgi:hypothetical protein